MPGAGGAWPTGHATVITYTQCQKQGFLPSVTEAGVDLDFTAEQVEFRDEVRTWLAGNAPSEPRPHSYATGMREYDLAWQRAQWAGGWAGIAWPRAYGGRGLSTLQQLI